MLYCPMGKIDDMRRQREADHARRTGVAAAEVAVAAVADEGACAVCGKVRALRNGRVTSHQKGLGKFCAGSNREPAPATPS